MKGKKKENNKRKYDKENLLYFGIVSNFIIFILTHILKIYSLCISPLLGNNCRFNPSCSNYARQALLKFGLVRGGYLSIKRFCRCHPWGGSGDDPIPTKKTQKMNPYLYVKCGGYRGYSGGPKKRTFSNG